MGAGSYGPHMAAKRKSYVKGYYRKRPGGGRTWVSPHTRNVRAKQILAGGAVLVAALVGWAVFAKGEGRAPADAPPPVPASVSPPR